MVPKLTKADYTSRIMYMLSKKYANKFDKSFLKDQIRYFVLKNQITDQKILDLVRQNGIEIDSKEFGSEEIIFKLKQNVQTYLCKDLVLPLDAYFRKTIQSYCRIFFKNIYVLIYNKKVAHRIFVLKRFEETLSIKFFNKKKKAFLLIKKFNKPKYSALISFLHKFFLHKQKEFFFHFFLCLKNIKETQQKSGFNLTSIQENVQKESGSYQIQNLNYSLKNLSKIIKDKITTSQNNNDLEKNQKDEKDIKKLVKGIKIIKKIILKRMKDYFEEIYFFHDYLEIIEVEDKTYELEPKTIADTSINVFSNFPDKFEFNNTPDLNERNRFKTFRNDPRRQSGVSIFNIHDNPELIDMNNLNQSIIKSHYFLPEQQIHRSQHLLKNLKTITTIADIKGSSVRRDPINTQSQIFKSLGKSSLNPLFDDRNEIRNSLYDERQEIRTSLDVKKNDIKLNNDRDRYLSFKSLEEKNSPIFRNRKFK